MPEEGVFVFPIEADLPENWVGANAITPSGTEAGLTPQHGYNYLMRKVNAALKAANFLSDAIENFDPGTNVTDASETEAGIIRIATQAEANAGSANNLVITPANLKALLVAMSALSAVPKGLVSMWSGTKATIPSGWLLCDGTNGTPDLRNKFIRGIGTGETDEAGATGGANTVTITTDNLPAHVHTIAHTHGAITGSLSSAGSHTHTINTYSYAKAAYYLVAEQTANITSFPVQNYGSSNYYTVGSYSVSQCYYSRSPNAAGDHSHTLSDASVPAYSGNSGSVGAGTALSILPTYYALAFIIKT